MQKKRFMNFRLSLCLAVAMILIIVLTTKIFISQNFKLVLISIFSLLFILFLILFAFFKDKLFVLLSAFVLVMIIPVVSVYAKTERIKRNSDINVENCIILGKIYKLNEKFNENKIFIYLNDVKLYSSEKQENFSGDFLVIANSNGVETENLKNGSYIKVNCKPTIYSLENKDDRSLSYISRNIAGSCYVYSYNIDVMDKYSPELRDKVKNLVYSSFAKTDLFFTSVGYAMIFGDTTVLDEEIVSVFQNTGVAHLLAVSGFHISVIVAFLSFILNKLKTNKYAKLAVITGILIIYSYFCSFSPSVVRASVMAIVALYAGIRNKEYDGLSALSLAMVIILLINPLDLFNVSFVLSFVSVLSIILLMPVFNRLLSKVVYGKIGSMLSLSFSVGLGLSLFQLYYFGKVPILSFISNLVTVPIVSVLFIYVLVVCIIAPIFSIATPLINLFGIGMKYVLQFNNWLGNIHLMISIENVREIALVLSIALMFIVSDYVFLKKKTKIILSSSLAVLLVGLVVF